MARTRITRPTRQHRDADKLMALASALSASGSRVEDRYWEKQIDDLLTKLLRTGQDSAIEIALETLLADNPEAYELLIEQCETLSESTTLELDGQAYDVLLIVAPIAVWTRYQIPSGPIREETVTTLHAHLYGHVLAADVKLALIPALLSVDQMPRSFSATQQWLLRLGTEALNKVGGQKLELPTLGELPNMLADTRYLVGAIAVPQGQAMFRWQESLETDYSRAQAQEQWVQQAEPTLATLMPGCGMEILLPDAWYTGNRDADRNVRPLAVRASVAWLEGALGVPADQLRAVISGVGEQQIDEYRVGFTQRNSNEVVYGCIWPLFGRETAEDMVAESEQGLPMDTVDRIVDLLRQHGITEVRRLPGMLPPESCEDCGAPFFPSPLGEMMHAEMPEDAEFTPPQFH